MMLRADIICVPDDALGPFPHPDSATHARAFEPYISKAFTDQEAWEALFTDGQRIATFRVVYGNRKGKPRRPRQPQLSDGSREGE